MTVTEKERLDNIAGAVETSDRVASHLHPTGSFDVEDHPVPTGLEEIWRFTPLKRLRGLQQELGFGDGGVKVGTELADGVTLTEVGLSDPTVGSSGYEPTDRVSARAWQAATQVSVLTVPADQVVPGASVITVAGQGLGDGSVEGPAEGPAEGSAQHLVITARPHSRSVVVLRYEGSAILADTVEIVIEEGANLTVVSIQDWADDAVHHSTQHAKVGRDATFRHVAVSFGGDLVRLNASLAYDGPGGDGEMLGLYFADAGQHLEHRLFVDHNAPHTKSNVDYKGALQGRGAHTVWIGDVLIRKVAEGIETYESNRNLVLTDGCRADAVPNLEIETGEIAGAGHAATTGRFDDEQLFYLRSRGIDEAEARRLVVHGFFADIIRRIGVPEIEARLLDAVEAELAINIGNPEGRD